MNNHLESPSILEVKQKIFQDFSEARLEFSKLYFVSAKTWIDKTIKEDQGNPDDLICVSENFGGEHSFRVSITEAANINNFLVRVASVLQVDAMDFLGEPWPSLKLDQRFLGVLEPALSVNQKAIWQCAEFSCPIGLLQSGFSQLIEV